MLKNPDIITILPSTPEERNSNLPWPYGWSESFGFADKFKLYNPNNAAMIFTMLSNASVSIARELVRNHATIFTINNIIAIKVMIF